ncbi:MAG TPA: hypothetical protein PLK55_03095 [archaeon]|jgi:hypothetical protein|nr:hypothetical protein [archaeon]
MKSKLKSGSKIKYLCSKQAKPRLTILETELAKSWLTKEEDKAWKNL